MTTIWYVLIMAGIILYFMGQGMTQGFTFSTPKRRKENKLIRNQYKRRDNQKGFFSYHAVRVLMQNLGMAFVVIGTFFIKVTFLRFTWWVIGWGLIGLFLYERFFNAVSYGILFPKKDDYDLKKISFKRTWKQDVIALLIGIGLLILFFIF